MVAIMPCQLHSHITRIYRVLDMGQSNKTLNLATCECTAPLAPVSSGDVSVC